jgi:SagB-type dehydrogenase family enzyme
MSLEELSRLLHCSAGVTDERHGLRAAPSAGATYPIEVYAAVARVEGLPMGIYRYLVSSDELAVVREGDYRRELRGAALGQRMVADANLVLALSAVFERIVGRYRERATRYIFMEAGHIAQNACLVATSMGLGTCAIGAFQDEGVNRVLGLDGNNESALYLVAVGKV